MDNQLQTEQLLVQHNVELNEDLTFLLGVAVNLEQRIEKWQNRTSRSVNLALAMNRLAGCPVDNEQLTAAVLAHDIGMGFLPHSVLNKPGHCRRIYGSGRHQHHTWCNGNTSPQWNSFFWHMGKTL